LVGFAKKKEERRGKEEDVVNLAKIHLNLKSSKFDPSGGDDWLRSDFQMVEVHLPSFRIFEQVEVGFW
jgi:hypothetical protein